MEHGSRGVEHGLGLREDLGRVVGEGDPVDRAREGTEGWRQGQDGGRDSVRAPVGAGAGTPEGSHLEAHAREGRAGSHRDGSLPPPACVPSKVPEDSVS